MDASTQRHAVDQLLRLREAMGAAGRQRVEGRSWATLTDELLGHYAAVRPSAAAVA